ncbi:MAG: hypothetical protein G01um101413_857 [Parcubacteria group bacterium Gr01-1014_13]|nr:MAG: hypothetical protein G01um101413_857 [Parcubacteria group bacterium Gr01-1014_13]
MENDKDDDDDKLYSVEEILELQEKDEEPIRLAVEEVLLPSLEGEALELGRKLADTYGAYNLYAATQGISSLLHRYLIRHPEHQIEWYANDSVSVADVGVVIGQEDLVLEVARFTDLWDDESGAPIKDVFKMVRWVWMAMKSQPRLLPYFIAKAESDFFLYKFSLTKVDAKDRIDDPRQRWRRSPSKQS